MAVLCGAVIATLLDRVVEIHDRQFSESLVVLFLS